MQPMSEAERQKLIDRFGLDWANQKQWEAYVVGAFNAKRAPGKHLRLFTDWQQSTDASGKFQVWLMQASADAAPTYSKGVLVTVSKTATYSEIETAMADALADESNWTADVSWKE